VYPSDRGYVEFMITFKYNEEKTAQISALFIKAHGGLLNYTKLIKLLYLADREAFRFWERPLTGDSYFSMRRGPILSNTLDLITNESHPKYGSFWYKFIVKDNFDVKLLDDPGFDELSKREIDLIERIYEKYKDKDQWQMIDICHEVCTEWKDPGDTSLLIKIEDILRELNKTEEEIKLIDQEISGLKYADFILSADQ
jgi:uncharacterized phage-associated protein